MGDYSNQSTLENLLLLNLVKVVFSKIGLASGDPKL